MNFFSPSLLRQEIIQTFQSKIFSLNKDKPTYAAWKKKLWKANGGGIGCCGFLQKKNKIKKRRFKDVDENFFDCLDLRKTKMVVEFSNRESARSKSFAVKKMKQNKNDHSIHVWQATNVC